MRTNIEEVKAERQQTIQEEKHYRMGVKPITHFPYTHGDTVEAQRALIREEMHQDLRNRSALLEEKEREKYGDELYEKMYGPNSIEPATIKDINIYPQGGHKLVSLRNKFE